VSAAGGLVSLVGGATISGGTVSAASGSNIDVTSATFTNLTIAAGSNVIVLPSDTLTLSGPTITNKGVIQIDQDSSNADLNVSSNTLLTGSGTVMLDDYTPNARLTSSAGATLTVDTNQTIDGVGEIDTALINNGTVSASVSGHEILLNKSISGTGTLGATSGATLVLAAGTGGSSQGSLSITGTGKLDITDNHLLINYTSGHDPISSIVAMIVSGYAGGSWNGAGIMSSTAQSNSGSYAIGYADSADPGNPAGLASNQIEIKYTLLGDANLDDKVNGADFTLMAANFNDQVTNGWDKGDFNYDNKVNGADFVLLADNFNDFASQSDVSAADLAALDSFAAANGISLANVPEPASMAISVMAGLGILRCRRRRSSRSSDPK